MAVDLGSNNTNETLVEEVFLRFAYIDDVYIQKINIYQLYLISFISMYAKYPFHRRVQPEVNWWFLLVVF